MENGSTLTVGDWIVHKRYGIGQIQGTETKAISGEPTDYYRIETPDSVVWLPVGDINEDAFRPLSSQEQMQEALDILRKPPEEMASNFNTRKKRIKDTKAKNTVKAVARIVRDLWGRQTGRTLSNTEHRALRRFVQRLAAEWSVCTGVDVEVAKERLYEILRESHAERERAMAN